MTVLIVLLGTTVAMMCFSIYIIGLISSKIDLMLHYLKVITSSNEEVNSKRGVDQQFMGMMNYTAEDWRESDE